MTKPKTGREITSGLRRDVWRYIELMDLAGPAGQCEDAMRTLEKILNNLPPLKGPQRDREAQREEISRLARAATKRPGL